MNAVVASGVPAAEMTAGFDTAWLDFTKGLGAPLGACLGGLGRADRGGLALQADARRRAAPGGDRRRRRALRARPQRRAARRATTPTRAALAEGLAGDRRRDARSGRGRDQHRHLRGRRSRTRCAPALERARRADGRGGRAPDPGRHALGRRRRRGTTCRAGRPGERAGRAEGTTHEARRHPPHHGDHRRRAAQRRLLRPRPRAAAGQEDGQPGRPDRLPPLLRRRARLGGRGPDVLRVRRTHGTGRAGAGMVHRIAHRVASADSLDFWEQRLGDEGVATSRAGGDACASPTPRASRTSSSSSTCPTRR